MLCPRLSERLPKIKLSEFLYSEWGEDSINILTFPYRDVSEYACGHADDTP
jgi:hypothetical protein